MQIKTGRSGDWFYFAIFPGDLPINRETWQLCIALMETRRPRQTHTKVCTSQNLSPFIALSMLETQRMLRLILACHAGVAVADYADVSKYPWLIALQIS